MDTKDPVTEYNPYVHRRVHLPNSFTGALIHLLKGSLGTGTLAVPSAVAAAGIIPGVIGIFLIGLISAHSFYLLVHTSEEMCKIVKEPVLGFSQTAEAVLKYGPKRLRPYARTARIIVDISLATTYYGCLAVYIVFMCTNIQQLVGFYYSEVNTWPLQYFMLILLFPLIAFCQIRELKHLVPFSLVANISMALTFLITFYYVFDGIGEINIEDRKLFNGFGMMPYFFSTILFSMEGIGVVLPIANSMLNARFMGTFGVSNIGMTCVTILYAIIGFCGYYKYGDYIGPNIIANFNPAETLAQIAQALVVVSVFFTFLLQFYVPTDITWGMLREKVPKRHHRIAEILMRILLVVAVTIVAAAVPKLDAIIGLVGSLFFSTLGLMVTAVIDTIRLSGLGTSAFGFLRWRLWKNLCILALWLVGSLSGSWYAVKNLIN